MKKTPLIRLVPIVVVLAAFAVILSSCNLLLGKASVRFTNQTGATLQTVSLGSISVGPLANATTTAHQYLDSGTYTLTVWNPTGGSISWPNAVTVADPKSYTVVFFGTWPYLGVQVTED